MSEMVERVAAALQDYADTLQFSSMDRVFIYAHRMGLARAAIAAMREPTKAMVNAAMSRNIGFAAGQFGGPIWREMIDEALK